MKSNVSPITREHMTKRDIIEWSDFRQRRRLRLHDFPKSSKDAVTYYSTKSKKHILTFSLNQLCDKQMITVPIQMYSTNIETRYVAELIIKITNKNTIGLYWNNRFTTESKFLVYPIKGHICFTVNEQARTMVLLGCDLINGLSAKIYKGRTVKHIIKNVKTNIISNDLYQINEQKQTNDNELQETSAPIITLDKNLKPHNSIYSKVEFIAGEDKNKRSSWGFPQFSTLDKIAGPDGNVVIQFWHIK